MAESVRVICRCRPLNQREIALNSKVSNVVLKNKAKRNFLAYANYMTESIRPGGVGVKGSVESEKNSMSKNPLTYKNLKKIKIKI